MHIPSRTLPRAAKPHSRRLRRAFVPVVAGLGLAALADTMASAADVYLPIVMPITGFLSVEGGSQRNGAVMALEQAPGGMKADYPIFDTGTSATGAATALDKAASDDAVFTVDVGSPSIWAARYLRMNGKRRLVGSLTHGSMANALPQAIGAQVSHPGRQVITMSGDGGLAMLMGELLTLRQHDLPVKLVVFKNDSLAFVELEMKASGFLDFATDLKNPDFAKIAEGAGLLGLRAETADQVEPAIAQALKHEGPALVEVHVSRQELSMPPTITFEQAKGFGIFMLKAVLSGRGDEIIDLAKVNLLR